MGHRLWSDVKSFLNEDNSSITYRINNLQHKVSVVFLSQRMFQLSSHTQKQFMYRVSFSTRVVE